MGWKSKLERARRLHRPSLKDWKCDGLYETFPAFAQKILEQNNLENGSCYSSSFSATNNGGPCVEPLPVVLDAKHLSPVDFADNYEAKAIPCVIRNIPQGHDHDQTHDGPSRSTPTYTTIVEKEAAECRGGGGRHAFQKGEPWPAVRSWTANALEDDSDLKNRYFKCGEDDNEKSIKIKLKYFMEYVKNNKDDSPLYIFDSSFDEDKGAKRILGHYRVPTYFRDDLFRLISESRRPPYRWFLVGPKRSGTTVHIDPLATSAWNTLIHGKKRWVLFPPNTPKRIVKGRGLVRSDEDDEAIHYFMTILPRIKRKARSSSSSSSRHGDGDGGTNGEYNDFCCYEFTQHAGETVYIPNGWWHAVLNLTDTVGVTQNFCSPRNFNHVWIQTRTGRKRMAYKWLMQLETHYPHLAARAKAMNRKDNFVMKYDPVEIRKREKEAARKKHDKYQRARQREKKKRSEAKVDSSVSSFHSKRGERSSSKRCDDSDHATATATTSRSSNGTREPKRSRHVSP